MCVNVDIDAALGVALGVSLVVDLALGVQASGGRDTRGRLHVVWREKGKESPREQLPRGRPEA